jgi:hypothetical protein
MIDLDLAVEYWDELVLADGFNKAIVGIQEDTGIVFYSREKVIQILMKDLELDLIDAIDYAEFNVFNTYVGEKTPVFLHDFFIENNKS